MSLLALLANVNCFHRDNMKTFEGGRRGKSAESESAVDSRFMV